MSGFFRFRLEHRQEIAQDIPEVADDREIDADVLVDRGRIDVDVNLFEPGENASVRPVMRSSKRAPTHSMTSQSCIAMLAS